MAAKVCDEHPSAACAPRHGSAAAEQSLFVPLMSSSASGRSLQRVSAKGPFPLSSPPLLSGCKQLGIPTESSSLPRPVPALLVAPFLSFSSSFFFTKARVTLMSAFLRHSVVKVLISGTFLRAG